MKSLKMIMMAALTVFYVALAAQDTTKIKTKPVKKQSEKVMYTCPIHPDVMMEKSGKCPKCGRDLTKSLKEQMKMEVMGIYTCPAHPDVTSNESGKCPKCGNLLKLSPKEQMKMKDLKMFTCPMHPDVAMDKEGKCPKCGMDLKVTEMVYSCPNHPEVTSGKPGTCAKCGSALTLSLKEKKSSFIVICNFIKSYFLAMMDCMTRNRFVF